MQTQELHERRRKKFVFLRPLKSVKPIIFDMMLISGKVTDHGWQFQFCLNIYLFSFTYKLFFVGQGCFCLNKSGQCSKSIFSGTVRAFDLIPRLKARPNCWLFALFAQYALLHAKTCPELNLHKMRTPHSPEQFSNNPQMIWNQ